MVDKMSIPRNQFLQCYGELNLNYPPFLRHKILFLTEQFRMQYDLKSNKVDWSQLFCHQKRMISALHFFNAFGLNMVVGDPVGSGKTLTIIFFLNVSKLQSTTDIIIVPFSLFHFWRKQLELFSDHSFVAINSIKALKSCSDTSLILITDTMVNHKLFNDSFLKKYSINFCVVDEYDTIKLNKKKYVSIDASKRILSSATMFTTPSDGYFRRHPKLVRLEFMLRAKTIPKPFQSTKLLILVNQNIISDLPALCVDYFVIRDPLIYYKYGDFVSKSILFDINTEGSNENDLVDKIFDGKKKKLKFHEECLRLKKYSWDKDKITQKIKLLKESILNIRKRMLFEECPVCLTESQNIGYFICSVCKNSFCIACGASLSTCPLCREKKSFIAVSDQPLDLTNGKFDALSTILEKIKQTQGFLKAVIYIPKLHITDRLIHYLKTKNYDCALYKVSGRGDISYRQLELFRQCSNGILILSDESASAGLNLQFCNNLIIMSKLKENIKNQVIGRCYRIPRETPLNLQYIYFQNELSIKDQIFAANLLQRNCHGAIII